MAVQTFYRPARDDQLKSGTYRAFNCGPCATRVAIRRHSLGSLNPTITGIRKAAGNTSSWFSALDVSQALQAFGVGHELHQRNDDFEIPDLAARLKAGDYAVALGDYEQVPDSL